jgi:hypothetical protein
MFASVCKLLALASLLEQAAAFTTARTLLPLRTYGPRHANFFSLAHTHLSRCFVTKSHWSNKDERRLF